MSALNVVNHGSLITLEPRSEEVRDWLVASTSDEAMWIGGALVVEPRYAQPIIDGANSEFPRTCIADDCDNPVPWNQGSDYCAACILEEGEA